MNFQLDEKKIRSLTTNQSTFQKGLSYYKQKRVSSIEFFEKSNQLHATVEGNSDDYEVVIDFDASHGIENFSCDCPAFSSYAGACKHIIATLCTVKKKNINQTVSIKPSPSNHQLLSYYEYINENTDLEVVKLELILILETYGGRVIPSIQMKIGKDRMYVVRDIEEFILKHQSKTPLEFGKNFEYDPLKHELAGVDKILINILEELYENEKFQSVGYRRYSKISSAFKGKDLHISQATLKRILVLLERKPFFLKIFDKEIANALIVDRDMPLSFSLSQSSGNRNLKLVMGQSVMHAPITTDGSYFLYGDTIYKISEKQLKYYSPIYNEFNQQKGGIIFTGDERSRFISSVLPYLKKICSVKLDAALEKSLYQTNLLAKVYLDKSSIGITANIEFHYGAHTFNPFTSVLDNEQGDRIVVRDIEGERNVLDSFEKSDFRVRNGAVYLDEEDKIFEFIYYNLPLLQDFAEIYYSDDFKTINIKDSRGFKSGLRINNQSDLLEFSFQHEDIDGDELSNIFASLQLKKKYYRLKDGSFMPLDDGRLESMVKLLESMDITGDDLNNKVLSLPKFRSVYLDSQLTQLNLGHIDKNQAFKQLVQNIKEPQDMEFEIPATLNSIMREYQKIGFKWLKTLAAYDMGGILADDMGLGKTLQAIAFMLSYKTKKAHPFLVIAPTSLLYNWKEEVYKFAPELKVLLVSGLPKQRQQQVQEIKDTDIVVTSYPLIRRDIELYKELKFEYCFIDEAQHIKNPASINAKSVKQIKAKGYFALTGTPIENSLTELWSIFDFIMPGYLLTYSKFSQKYEKPIVKSEDDQALDHLSSQITPFILRRLKKDVLKELPDKIETRLVAELTDNQKKIYLAFLQQAKTEIVKEIADKGFGKSHIKILSTLTRLRQICCHPSLFIDDYDGASGKMQLLEEVVEDALEGGHRILLFSQFTSMLKIIEKWLTGKEINYLYLDGETPTEKRGELVKKFNAGIGSIFLISLKSGGTGLNLTGADMVIHFDPWWNPAVEDQATDRAHRIGQEKVVQVFKLITQGTIEEKVYQMQQKKKHLVESLIKPGETFITKLSEDDIKSLFEV